MLKPFTLTWRIYHQPQEKFPYWLFIEQEKNSFLFLKAKDKWPGPGKNIFCLFEGKVLTDLFAQFPCIQFIFFKGRKSANHWLFYYFQQVCARLKNYAEK